MNGRVYDPFLGKMLSADPTIPGPFNSQAFNRYSYVLNSPLRFMDPSGFGPEGFGCGGSPSCRPAMDGRGGHDFGTRSLGGYFCAGGSNSESQACNSSGQDSRIVTVGGAQFMAHPGQTIRNNGEIFILPQTQAGAAGISIVSVGSWTYSAGVADGNYVQSRTPTPMPGIFLNMYTGTSRVLDLGFGNGGSAAASGRFGLVDPERARLQGLDHSAYELISGAIAMGRALDNEQGEERAQIALTAIGLASGATEVVAVARGAVVLTELAGNVSAVTTAGSIAMDVGSPAAWADGGLYSLNTAGVSIGDHTGGALGAEIRLASTFVPFVASASLSFACSVSGGC